VRVTETTSWRRSLRRSYLDDVEVAKIVDYEAALHDFARANNQDALDAINESGDYNDEIEAQLKGICDAFAEKGAY
jgi:F-type H+-transporting ATPase subunit alpha